MAKRKMLVVGQSGSGKSSFILALQKKYNRVAYQEERILCQLEIQRTIVRSTNIILEALSTASGSGTRQAQALSRSVSENQTASSAATNRPEIAASLILRLSVSISLIQHQLTPDSNCILPQVELPLQRQRSKGCGASGRTEKWTDTFTNSAAKLFFKTSSKPWDGHEINLEHEKIESVTKEVQKTLGKTICCDLIPLWKNVDVRGILRKVDVDLEEVVEKLLLNDLDRVTSSEYVPTEDDILKWRYRAVGTNERKFILGNPSEEWLVIELGRRKGQRHIDWAPFLTKVDLVILLTSASGFDEKLPEDKSINLIEDSRQLWKEIVCNRDIPLAGKILILNKCDIAVDKLRSGIKFPYTYSSTSPNEPFNSNKKYDRAELTEIFKFILRIFNDVLKAEIENQGDGSRPTGYTFFHMTTMNETQNPGTLIIPIDQIIQKIYSNMRDAVHHKILGESGVF